LEIQDEIKEFSQSDLQYLVSIELADDCHAQCFQRFHDGKVQASLLPFKPFLLTSTENLAEGLPGVERLEKLQGNEFYNTRLIFSGHETYSDAIKELKRKASPSQYRIFSDIQQQIMFASGVKLFHGMQFSDFRRLQLDIETLSSADEHFPDASRPEDIVTLVSLKDSTGWETCLTAADGEKKLLEDMIAAIVDRDPDVIEGHNIFNFDLQYLSQRCKMHKIPFAIGRCGQVAKFRSSRFTAGERTTNYMRCDVYGRHVVDTYQLVQLYDISHRDMESYGLKNAARYFGVNSADRTYVDGKEISETYLNNTQKLIEYCLDDARETDAISRILSPSYFYQTKLVPLSYQNCILRGTATRIDGMLCCEYLRRGVSLPIPQPPVMFKGGLTESFVSGVYDNVWHLDVASLYPSVILSSRLSPHSDTLGLFIDYLSKLREFRLEAKAAAKKAEGAEKEHLEALQSSYKILINSFYGYAGFAQGTFNDFEMASAVASKGRDILRSMEATLTQNGATVIEMDTDGLYFQPPAGSSSQEMMRERVQAILPEGISVELDATYKSMFAYKSKNYALLTHDGTLSLAGAALKSRGLEPFQRRYMRELILLLLERRTDEAAALYEKYVEDITQHRLPLADFAKRDSVTMQPAAYADKLKSGETKRNAAMELALKAKVPYRQGDNIFYYVTGTKKKVSIVDNVRNMDEADENVRDENIAFYLEKLHQLHLKLTVGEE